MERRTVDPDSVETSILVTRPGRPGDPVTKVARIARENGEETLAVLVGEVRRKRTLAGEEVLVEGVESAIELGTDADIDRLIDGLERLQEGATA